MVWWTLAKATSAAFSPLAPLQVQAISAGHDAVDYSHLFLVLTAPGRVRTPVQILPSSVNCPWRRFRFTQPCFLGTLNPGS